MGCPGHSTLCPPSPVPGLWVPASAFPCSLEHPTASTEPGCIGLVYVTQCGMKPEAAPAMSSLFIWVTLLQVLLPCLLSACFRHSFLSPTLQLGSAALACRKAQRSFSCSDKGGLWECLVLDRSRPLADNRQTSKGGGHPGSTRTLYTPNVPVHAHCWGVKLLRVYLFFFFFAVNHWSLFLFMVLEVLRHSTVL